MLNYLMNSYIGCIDDAADLIQLGMEKQDNIRQCIDLMASKSQEFLAALKKYSANGPELTSIKTIWTTPLKAPKMPSAKPKQPKRKPRRHL